MKMHTTCILLCGLLPVSTTNTWAFSTFYSVDFEDAGQVVGLEASDDTGAYPRTGPSDHLQGSSEVLAAGVGPFSTKSLSFVPALDNGFNMSQLEFALDTPATDFLQVSFDLYLNNFADAPNAAFIPGSTQDYFSVLFDTPTTTRIDFTAPNAGQGLTTGRILTDDGTTTIGTYDPGTFIEVEIAINVLANTWEVDMRQNALSIATLASGTTFFEEFGQVTYSGMIERLRLAFVDGDGSGLPSEAVIDNFTLVPEPAHLAGMMALLALMASAFRRSPKT